MELHALTRNVSWVNGESREVQLSIHPDFVGKTHLTSKGPGSFRSVSVKSVAGSGWTRSIVVSRPHVGGVFGQVKALSFLRINTNSLFPTGAGQLRICLNRPSQTILRRLWSWHIKNRTQTQSMYGR